MTSLDVARIETRNTELLLALDVQSTIQRSIQPPQLTLEESSERSNSIGTSSVMVALQQSTELTSPPPKKKR